RIACAIVAGNRWEGYSSEERTGSSITTSKDGFSLAKEYYFRVLDDAEQYPLAPSFADWLFPHRYLTSIWPQFSVPDMPPSRALPPEGGLIDALLAHDITCRLTDTVEGTEHAHLVLCSEVARFQQNTMFRYDASPRPEVEPINVPRNALSLRSDIHIVFDQRRFATVSKPLSSGETGRENFTLAVHLISTVRQPLPPYRYAAIAWYFVELHICMICLDCLCLLSTVPATRCQRALCIVQDGELTVRDYNGDQCTQLYQSRRARSLGPSKRKRDNGNVV
ncbi:hypothetical protein D6D08_06736, partial [Aureobasidium pullulans]